MSLWYIIWWINLRICKFCKSGNEGVLNSAYCCKHECYIVHSVIVIEFYCCKLLHCLDVADKYFHMFQCSNLCVNKQMQTRSF